MRLDSVVNAAVGSVAIHVGLAVMAYTLLVTRPLYKPPPPAKIELVNVEVPPIVKPPPPPVKEDTPKVPDLPPVPQAPVQHVARAASRPIAPPPPTELPPPTTTPSTDDEGGAPVTTMEDIAPAATGVAVAKGPRTTKIGRGGSGAGTGAGSGAGSSDAVPAPVSVATIKSRAMPKGDFSYVDASKDYPAEAKSLGIEGQIRVKLIVDDAGYVKSATLLNKLGHGLDELALARANKIVFDPAKDTDDKPVSSVVIWTFNMTLPK